MTSRTEQETLMGLLEAQRKSVVAILDILDEWVMPRQACGPPRRLTWTFRADFPH